MRHQEYEKLLAGREKKPPRKTRASKILPSTPVEIITEKETEGEGQEDKGKEKVPEEKKEIENEEKEKEGQQETESEPNEESEKEKEKEIEDEGKEKEREEEQDKPRKKKPVRVLSADTLLSGEEEYPEDQDADEEEEDINALNDPLAVRKRAIAHSFAQLDPQFSGRFSSIYWMLSSSEDTENEQP